MDTVGGGGVYRTGKGNGGWGIKEFNCDSQLTNALKVSLGYLCRIPMILSQDNKAITKRKTWEPLG